MKISLVSPLDPFSSFGRHAIRIIDGLQRAGIEVVARPIKISGQSGAIPEFVKVQHGDNDCPIEIILGHPEIAPTKGKRSLYYSAWESTRLPKRSVEILNLCERVIVPSNYCAVTHSASGVDVPIDVVPLGYDDRFHYMPLRASGPFVFACAGNLWNGARRKGVQAAIDLFRLAFPDKSDAHLNVKLFPGNKVETYGDSRISVFDQFMDDTTFHAWMAEAHCFVHFGIGAFESQVLEFMAMGRGVIAMKFGGHADFFCDSVGLEVTHRLYPADRKWTDHGCFAEPDRDSAVRAFRWAKDNFDHMESIGLDACKSVRHFTWDNSIKKLIKILEEVTPKVVRPDPVIEVKRSADPMDDVTVCITSFNRPKHLDRALKSSQAAGFKTVIAEMFPDSDLGCNELWLQAAYKSNTNRVIILHDDDVLRPELGRRYREIIHTVADECAVTWRGEHLWENGKVTPTEYWSGSTNTYPIKDLEKFLLQRGKLSLSPIVTVFDRKTLIHALKEADDFLIAPQSFLRPGMLLGTEVLAHLRQAQSRGGWYYLNEVLSQYGVHDGSGTYAAEKSGDLSKLTAGYDYARDHFEQYRDAMIAYKPKLLLLSSPFTPKDKPSLDRIMYARQSWKARFKAGTMLDFQVPTVLLPRTGSIPFLRDMLDRGCSHAMPEDIVIYANADIVLSADVDHEIITGVKRGGGVCAAWRRSLKDGKIDGGIDLIAVTPSWWSEHRGRIPDMYLCATYWDWVFRIYAERLSGQGVYISDGTYHEPHESLTSRLGHSTPEQRHNATLAKKFFSDLGMQNEAASIRV